MVFREIFVLEAIIVHLRLLHQLDVQLELIMIKLDKLVQLGVLLALLDIFAIRGD